jgi:hypothetical protein
LFVGSNQICLRQVWGARNIAKVDHGIVSVTGENLGHSNLLSLQCVSIFSVSLLGCIAVCHLVVCHLVVFGGLDEVADSQLLALLAAPALAAHGIEDVAKETAPLGADVLGQINLLRRDLVSPAQLVDQLNRIVAVDAELVKGLLRRNAAFRSNQSSWRRGRSLLVLLTSLRPPRQLNHRLMFLELGQEQPQNRA